MNRLQSAETRGSLQFHRSESVSAAKHETIELPTFAPSEAVGLLIEARLSDIQRNITALLQNETEAPEYFRIPPLTSRRVKVRVRSRQEGYIRLVTDEESEA